MYESFEKIEDDFAIPPIYIYMKITLNIGSLFVRLIFKVNPI